jgi:hypothetical protein
MQNPSVPYESRSSRHTDGVSDPRYPQYGPPPGYGPPVYGPPGYGPPAYGPPGYGPPPGYPPPYGAGYGAPEAPPWAFATATWPYGPGRPPLATAAGVLGYVTAGLTIVFSLIFLLVLLSGKGDPTQWVLVLGLPCAAGLLVGGVRIMRRRSAGLLFASAASAVAVLMVSLIVGMGWLPEQEIFGEAVFVVLALPLPLLTAVFARARTVTGWLAAGR